MKLEGWERRGKVEKKGKTGVEQAGETFPTKEG